MNKEKIYNGNIYKFENKINGKIYIGQSRCIERRYESHVYCDNPKYELDRAIKKYGIDNFNYDILESFNTSDLDEVNKWMDEREDYYIKFYNCLNPNGYNLLSNRHHPEFSEITKERISEACTGEKNGFYGKKHSDETKKQMKESAAKRDNTNEGKYIRTEEHINNWKKMINEKWITIKNDPKRYRKYLDKKIKTQKKHFENMTDEEYNEWKTKRYQKSKETIEKRKQEGKIYKGSTTGKKAINNGIIGKKVLPEEVNKYLQEGWKLGALWNKHKIEKNN